MVKNKSKSVFISLMSIVTANALDNIELDKVEAVEKNEVYLESKAVSTRDFNEKSSKNIDDVVRSIAGAFTNIDNTQGTVNINIRGMSGLGRVNTMIDGVTQTFYSTSADNSSRNGGTSTFGAMIDSSFLRGVDVEKGSFSGKGGANSLMGSANLRTISINDIVRDGNRFGFLTSTLFGNNSTGPKYSNIIALKEEINDGYFGVLYGYSQNKISQDFEVGGGNRVTGVKFQPVLDSNGKQMRGDNGNGDLLWVNPQTGERTYFSGNPSYDPSSLAQKTKSNIAKVEYKDNINKLVLSYRDYKTALTGRKVTSNNYQLDYNLKSPEYKNLDLNLIVAKSIGKQQYKAGSTFAGVELLKNIQAKNTSTTFDISNTFDNDFGNDGNIKTRIGFNLLKNRYEKSRHPKELNFLEDNFKDAQGFARMKLGYEANTLYPEGGQKFNTVYIDNEINYGIFTFTTNINYAKNSFWGERFQNYNLHMFRPLVNFVRNKFGNDIFTSDDPEKKAIVNELFDFYQDQYKEGVKTYERLMKGEITNDDRKYRKYQIEEAERWAKNEYYDYEIDYGICDKNNLSECYKNIMQIDSLIQKTDGENIKAATKYDNPREIDHGNHNYINYSFGTSVYLHDLFSPFVNYSKTHRAPNIKEMFFSDYGQYGVNSNLRPETAINTQLGFNSFKDGIFTDNDEFGFKFVKYKTKIKDYIYNIRGNERTSGRPLYIKHFNSKTDVSIKGFEIEASYDSGIFYANISYSRQKTNQPFNFTDSSPRVDDLKSEDETDAQGYGLTKVTILPDDYATIDLGARLFNEKFTVGGIGKYYGKSRITSGNLQRVDCNGNIVKEGDNITYVCGYSKKEYELKKQPWVFDFYSIYQPNNNLTIKFEIQNMFDTKYISPLDSNNDSANQFIFELGSASGYQFANNNFARGRTAMMSINYKY
ncbi:TonB-dependent receptor domain-containing protein [Campylobacter pinnipediorum]|uniref:TonB-dependent receptor domain-containing protein n=1 Tax=Campylobacter pinnipediorum TaxID=1965231 RepID=UPI0009AF1188|nr:TonB-dependent receptor [Campylobacter pinnipediorum]